jgi:hypothetical protein
VIDECSGFRSKIHHRGWTKCSLILILRKHNCGLLPAGTFRQCTMYSCSYQRYGMWSKRLKMQRSRWLAPQAIGSKEKLMVNEIMHLHSCEPSFHIINNLGEICMVTKKLLNLNPNHSLRPHIQLVTTDNSSLCLIRQLFSDGTYLQCQLCIIWGVVHIINLREQH